MFALPSAVDYDALANPKQSTLWVGVTEGLASRPAGHCHGRASVYVFAAIPGRPRRRPSRYGPWAEPIPDHTCASLVFSRSARIRSAGEDGSDLLEQKKSLQEGVHAAMWVVLVVCAGVAWSCGYSPERTRDDSASPVQVLRLPYALQSCHLQPAGTCSRAANVPTTGRWLSSR